MENNSKILVLPLSILLAGVMIATGILLGANRLVSSNELITKSFMQQAVTEVINGDLTTPTTAQNVEVTTTIDDDPFLGNKDTAKLAIIEFSDYECPYCKQYFSNTYSEVKKNYVDAGTAIYVFRDFPLGIHDPNATEQAEAAECVQDISGTSKYFEFHDLLFTTTASNKSIPKNKLYDLTKQIGVDETKFKECFDSRKFKDEVQKDIAEGNKIGVDGTPGFIIGKLNSDGSVKGVLLTGSMPFANFKAVADQQLAK